ncbi:tyrosinase family protein [Micromonospora chersina]|uniref:tyrosinase family protein n=1 Tax=Micromonospora chersina TaxID=47854 RepID=UPI003716AAC6
MIQQYTTDQVVAIHASGHDWHHSDTALFFTRHRDYIAGLEAFLTQQGAGHFVLLPKWDPATQIPAEFMVARPWDNGTPRQPPLNNSPNRPLPADLSTPDICGIPTGDELAIRAEGWHDGVHGAVGGSFASIAQAPACPLSWCWHAFIDDIYEDWLSCKLAWESLGGILASSPEVVSWSNGRLDVFARAANSSLDHWWWDGFSWGRDNLGGAITSNIAATSWASDRLDVFARAADNSLQHWWWDGFNWGRDNLGGTLTSDPTVASWASDRLDVFARAADNSLQHWWWDGSNWGQDNLGGTLTSDPTVASWASDRLDVFARAADNSLQHWWWDGSNWGQDNLGGTLTSDPTVASWASDRLDVFARGSDSSLQHKWWDGQKWSP